jgi:hypothetical protein
MVALTVAVSGKMRNQTVGQLLFPLPWLQEFVSQAGGFG